MHPTINPEEAQAFLTATSKIIGDSLHKLSQEELFYSLEQLLGEMTEELDHTKNPVTIYLGEHLVFERRADGKRAVDRLAEANPYPEGSMEARTLKSYLESFYSVIQIVEKCPGGLARFKDAIRGGEGYVNTAQTGNQEQLFDFAGVRLLRFSDQVFLTRFGIIISQQQMASFRTSIAPILGRNVFNHPMALKPNKELALGAHFIRQFHREVTMQRKGMQAALA